MIKAIGIRREDKNEWERRVPIIPADVRRLKETHGIHTIVQPSAIRVFSDEERIRLDAACRGYIMYLENIGILPPAQRELVIDRVMALGDDEVDVDHIKWVVLMVLFSQPGQESAYARMEDLVYENRMAAAH